MTLPTWRLMTALALGLVLAAGAPAIGQQGPPEGRGGGPPEGRGGGPPDGGGGGEDEGYGNNLAVPVVFTEGHGVLGLLATTDAGLRPRAGEINYPVVVYPVLPYFDPATLVGDLYPQQTTSYWQADWADGLAEGVGEQALVVNWADNIVRQKWTTRSQIRVETVLYQTLATPMTGYNMTYMSGEGATEMWGTNGSTYESTYRTAYSVCARLKIEKITGPGGTVVPGVQSFDGAVYEGFGEDGPGFYGAEVNVSGNLIYGFNWTLSQWDLDESVKLGWWRLTFSLDPIAEYEVVLEEGGTPLPFSVNRNATLASIDPADLEAEAFFKPALPDPYTSVLEIEIISSRSGGRKPTSPGGGEGLDTAPGLKTAPGQQKAKPDTPGQRRKP